MQRPLSADKPVIDYFRAVPGQDVTARYSNAALRELAIAVHESPGGWRGGRRCPMTADELWESRRDRWLRVWAHLAGRDVPIMGSRARGRGHGIAWVLAQVAAAPETHPMDAESAVGWEITPDASSAGAAEPPRPAFTAHLAAARRLAGSGWSEVSWGELGSGELRGTWRDALPQGKRAAARVVHEQTTAAIAAATAFAAGVRGTSRARLDHHLRQVVVYLLHHGHRGLKPKGWRRTARVVFGLSYTPTARGNWDATPEARVLRRDFAAAKRLVALARSRPAP